MPYDISVVIALVFIIWSVREDVKAFRIPNYSDYSRVNCGNRTTRYKRIGR